MILSNLKVTVKTITNDAVALETDQGNTITLPKHLLPGIQSGAILFIAVDEKPLVSSEQHAKDILNEIIKD